MKNRTVTVERRSVNRPGRRESDRLYFDDCPRYEKHELTEEQMTEICTRAVEMAQHRSEQAIGSFVIHEGGGFLVKLMFLLGAAAFALYAWVERQGFKF